MLFDNGYAKKKYIVNKLKRNRNKRFWNLQTEWAL